MGDSAYNSLLKWGIENSESASNQNAPTESTTAERDPSRGLNPELLAQLMGGPSDADLMKEAMSVIHHPEATLENKLIAWDNFEQMIENLDNANNMTSLGLWMPLVQKLEDPEAEVRTMACWCIGTAVQNNVKSQERLLAVGSLPKIVELVINDPNMATRKKACMALSSGIRNYQPALDVAVKHLPDEFRPMDRVDATDMEQVDTIVDRLREHAKKA